MDIVQKNATQYTVSYFGLASSDISNEYILLFFGLFIIAELIIILHSFHQLGKSILGRKLKFQSIRLTVLLVPLFTISLIFLTHHLSGFPDIHRSGQLLGARVDPLFFKQIIVAWAILLITEIYGHVAYKRISKGFVIVTGSLSPFILNIMIMISHYAIKIPSVIY